MELDFRQLATGTRFEQMVRDLLITLEYPVVWSGVGPDDGKDLVVDEQGDRLFGGKPRKWLVSCKHNAQSNGSVSFAQLTESGSITSLVRAHSVDAFLVVCSTQVSAGCMRQLERIEANDRIPIQVWDSATFLRLAANPRVYALLQEYLPNTAILNQLKLFRTIQPNRFVVTGRGFYVLVEERHESELDFQLDSISDHLERIEQIQTKLDRREVLVRPRHIFFDNKHGAVRYDTEILFAHTSGDNDRIRFEVEHELLNPSWTRNSYYDGQTADHSVSERVESFSSDSFDKDHYTFYSQYR